MGYSLEVEKPPIPSFIDKDAGIRFKECLLPDQAGEKYYVSYKVLGLLETLSRSQDIESLNDKVEYLYVEHILLGRLLNEQISQTQLIEFQAIDTLLCFLGDETHITQEIVSQKYDEFLKLIDEAKRKNAE